MIARPRARRTAVVLAGSTLAALVAATASAAVPQESAKGRGYVTYVADGDTPYVDSGKVRLIGVQAPEVEHGSGGKTWCHGPAARKQLTSLVNHRNVQLRAMYSSSSNLGRPLRSVFVKQSGAYVNVQNQLIKAHKVFWFSQNTETQHNYDYHLATMKAASSRRGLWDVKSCGYGPSQDAKLTLWVHYHSNGSDSKNVNGQWIEIDNDGTKAVHLGRWHLRDSSLEMFTFPSNAQVPAGKSVRVHVGHGTNHNTASASTFYWNRDKPIYGEVSKKTGEGDMTILLDPDGDFRAWSDYPCVLSCADPLQGVLKITGYEYGRAGAAEWITLASRSSSRIHLDHYQLRSWPWNYVFKNNTYLDPGETLKVYTKSGNSSRLVQYMDEASKGILEGSGDTIDVSSMRDVQVDCVSWGSGSCHYDY